VRNFGGREKSDNVPSPGLPRTPMAMASEVTTPI
jgi:hypothetical protein